MKQPEKDSEKRTEARAAPVDEAARQDPKAREGEKAAERGVLRITALRQELDESGGH